MEPMPTTLGNQVPVAVITAYVLQWLKGQKWFPFAKCDSTWLNRFTAVAAALLTAGAVEYTFAPNGDFQLHGNIYTIMHLAWEGTQQYALQHVVYKIAIDPPPSPVTMTDKQMTGLTPIAVTEIVTNKSEGDKK